MALTSQELFDRVASHLLTQDEPSTNTGGSCRYRTQDGRMCAVGALIPDSLYSSEMEGSVALAPVVYKKLTEAGVLPKSQKLPQWRLLVELQRLHDGCAEAFYAFNDKGEPISDHKGYKRSIVASLKGLASRFKLSSKVIGTHNSPQEIV